jgi:hypothetical protein
MLPVKQDDGGHSRGKSFKHSVFAVVFSGLILNLSQSLRHLIFGGRCLSSGELK